MTLNSASTNVTGAVCICQIDTNKVAFAYNAVTSTPQACIGTISGNVLSN